MTTRILHIVESLEPGGPQKQMSLLAAALPPDEFDVHVCSLSGGGPLADELTRRRIRTFVVSRTRRFGLWNCRRLARHIRRLKPDVIHAWTAAVGRSTHLAALAAGGVRRLVVGERCVDRPRTPLEKSVDRCLARRSGRIVANSRCVRDVAAAEGLPAGRISVIPNGIAPHTPARTTSREPLLERLGLPAHARLLATIGRLVRHKRIENVIWALSLLKEIRDDAYLLVIGDGPQRRHLERYCRQVWMDDRTRLLGVRHDVTELLDQIDCLLCASDRESQSTAMMEAMAAGVPVVAIDAPGNRDLIVPEKTGYLVPLGGRAALARRANMLLDDEDLARQIGQAGRDRMRKHFSVEKMARRYAALYHEIVLS